MSKIQKEDSKCYYIYMVCLLSSIVLNVLFISNWYYVNSGAWNRLSWSRRAAEEAETVAAISCSGHGRAFLDGQILDGEQLPVCECNSCYGGPDCSQFHPSCSTNADGYLYILPSHRH